MMEGEPATPGVVRVPDEETAFVGRKVEAPRRRLRQQQRAQRKRLAVLTASAVTVVAFGTVCAFLTIPSESSGEVKAAVSQAMESDPTTANAGEVFVPNFAVYDEDGDGKVSLGEYLDRLSINRDAALKKLQASSLDELEKARIADLLNQDFDKHSECVARIAQEQHEDELMTKENFDKVYEKLTTEFCPMTDEDIPLSYQLKETASGKEELASINEGSNMANSDLWDQVTSEPSSKEGSATEADSSGVDSQSQSEDKWSPVDPDLPPRPIPTGDTPSENGITGSQPSEDKLWDPSYPTDPPVPSSTEKSSTQWDPDLPTYPPEPSTTKAPNSEAKWSPEEPTNPPRVVAGEQSWTPTEPTNPPKPNTEESKPGKANETKTWNPELPTYPPFVSGTAVSQAAILSSGNIKWNPEDTKEFPGAQKAFEGEQVTGTYNAYQGAAADTGAYNAYTGAETTKYGESTTTESFPETATQEYPGAQKAFEGEQATGAYNAYQGAAADTGAYNAYTGAETTKYGESTTTESFPETATQEYPGAQKAFEGEQATGAYNAYQGAATDTGAYNAYTGAETTKYGESTTTESFPETATQEYPGAQKAFEGEQATGAYNAYQGAAADTGAYNAYTGAETTKYGESTTTESFPETATQEYPGAQKAFEGEQATGAYNAYQGAAADTGAYNAYTGAETTKYGESTTTESFPGTATQDYPGAQKAFEGEQATGAYNAYQGAAADTGAYNAYTGAETTKYGESTTTESFPGTATQDYPGAQKAFEGEQATGAYNAYQGAAADTGAYNAYTGAETTKYGESTTTESFPETATQEYPGAQKAFEGEQATGAYNAYQGAATDTGAYNAYTGAETTKYGESTTTESFPETATQEYPGAQKAFEGEQATGAYNAYQGAAADTGAYNAYTGAETTKYGESTTTESFPETATQEYPGAQKAFEGEQATGAYNAYQGAAADTGAYNAYTGAETTKYGESTTTESFPETATQEYPGAQKAFEGEQATGAYNAYQGAAADTGAYNAYTGAETTKYGESTTTESFPGTATQDYPGAQKAFEGEQATGAYNAYQGAAADTGAYNAYTGAETTKYGESTTTESFPGTATQDYPGAQKAFEGEQATGAYNAYQGAAADTGAYNAYTGAETTKYGESTTTESFPETATQEYPGAQKAFEGEQATGAYNAYQGAATDTGAYNAYTGAETTKYGESTTTESFPETATQEYPGAQKAFEGEQATGAYNAYQGAAADTGAYNAYTGAETTKYGESTTTESFPGTATQEYPGAQKAFEGEQATGAYNAYQGAAADTGAYNAYTGAETTKYGESTTTESFPGTATQDYPGAQKAFEGEQATGAYNAYQGAAADTGAYNAYTGAETTKYGESTTTESFPETATQEYPGAQKAFEGEQATGAYNAYQGAATDTGAYNAYTGAETTKYGESTTTESFPETATQDYPGAQKAFEGEQATGAYNAYQGAAADTGAYNAYTGAETTKYGESTTTESFPGTATQDYPGAQKAFEGEQATGAYNAYQGAAADTGAYNAYTGAETTKYGESTTTESFPETATQEYPGAQKAFEGEQATGAYNAYQGAATDTGAYNAYTGAETTKYGESTTTESFPETATQEYPGSQKAFEGEQATGGPWKGQKSLRGMAPAHMVP